MPRARLSREEARRLLRRLAAEEAGSSAYHQLLEKLGLPRQAPEKARTNTALARPETTVGKLAELTGMRILAVTMPGRHEVLLSEVRAVLEELEQFPATPEEAEAFWGRVSWVIPLCIRIPLSLAWSVHYLLAPEHIEPLVLWLRSGGNSTSWRSTGVDE